MKLQAEVLTFRIKQKMILSDVSVGVAPGELVGLIGPNGAGKSTLLRLLAGVVEPHEGSVRIDTVDIGAMGSAERARVLAYMPQKSDVHWPIKVRDLVALGRLPFSRPFAPLSFEDQSAIDDAINTTDIASLADRIATTLSGGELARVLLARALAQTPQILLADEPTAGLDPAHQIRLLRLLKRFVEGGKSAIVVLHDLSLAARYCDRLVLLHEGRIHASGPARRVLPRAVLEEVYDVKAHISELNDMPLVIPLDVNLVEDRL